MADLDFPTSPANNQTYEANGIKYTYDAVKGVWNLSTAGDAYIATVTVANSAPGSPTEGNLWWDSESGKLFIYYTDINSSQWIEANPDGFGYTGSTGYTGSKGDQGVIGYTGSAGGLGYTGSAGTGYTGSAGNIGYTGSAGAGLTADIATTNTGSNTTAAVTPDGLAGSVFGTKYVQITCFNYTTNVTTGDGKGYVHIPSGLNGMNLIDCHAEVITAGNTGTLDIQLHNVTQAVDMLDPNFKLRIDDDETGSDTSANAAVINTSADGVSTNDLIRVDVDSVQTETAPQGLIVTMDFRLP
jgi:hypothetical protein